AWNAAQVLHELRQFPISQRRLRLGTVQLTLPRQPMGKVALPDGRILAGAVSASFCEIQNLLDAGAQQGGCRRLRLPNRTERAKDVVDFDLVNRKIAKHRHDVLGERAFEINRPLLTAPAGAVGSKELCRDLPETYARLLSSPPACRHLTTQEPRPQLTRLRARLLQRDS